MAPISLSTQAFLPHVDVEVPSGRKIDFIKELSNELALKIFSYLEGKHIGQCCLVSKHWALIGQDPIIQRIIVQKMAFGALKWKQHFDLTVAEPPFPADIHKIFRNDCPFFPGKKVAETHFLTLIPEGMTLESLEALTLNPRQENKIGFTSKGSNTWKQFGQKPTGKTHWALMTNDVIPGSRSKSWEYQQALVARYRSQGYECLSCLDASVSLLIEYVQTGRRFYTDNPWTYTRCVELENGQYPVVVGSFAPAGLEVSYYDGGGRVILGVGAVRLFS